MVKIPRFFKKTDYTVSVVPEKVEELNELEGDGSVFDTVKKRPSTKYRSIKKTKKQLTVMEDWIKFVQKKQGNS